MEEARAELYDESGWDYGIGAEVMLETYRDALQVQHEATLEAMAWTAGHGHGVGSMSE